MKTRQFTRYSTDIPVSIVIDHMLGEHQLYLQNISQGGLCFNAHGGIDRETQLNINLSIPGHSCDARGKIAWCKTLEQGQCQLGIMFEHQMTQSDIEKCSISINATK
ncbi:MAG: PilZ domain-containing protein [Gammaproteobacteria bacterium]|nr:PilZ domain-containing protein [Gammaproteobacteria bacterium]